jgi:hypothetical protein
MKPIICKNNVELVLNCLQEYAEQNTIRGLYLVDQSPDQVVILVSASTITQSMADAWWSGYTAALGFSSNGK